MKIFNDLQNVYTVWMYMDLVHRTPFKTTLFLFWMDDGAHNL